MLTGQCLAGTTGALTLLSGQSNSGDNPSFVLAAFAEAGKREALRILTLSYEGAREVAATNCSEWRTAAVQSVPGSEPGLVFGPRFPHQQSGIPKKGTNFIWRPKRKAEIKGLRARAEDAGEGR